MLRTLGWAIPAADQLSFLAFVSFCEFTSSPIELSSQMQKAVPTRISNCKRLCMQRSGHVLVFLHHRTPLVAPTDAKGRPIPSSNRFAFTLD
jgi:hypothetical protein